MLSIKDSEVAVTTCMETFSYQCRTSGFYYPSVFFGGTRELTFHLRFVREILFNGIIILYKSYGEHEYSNGQSGVISISPNVVPSIDILRMIFYFPLRQLIRYIILKLLGLVLY